MIYGRPKYLGNDIGGRGKRQANVQGLRAGKDVKISRAGEERWEMEGTDEPSAEEVDRRTHISWIGGNDLSIADMRR